MKILVCGDYRSIPIARRCADALEALGCTVDRVDSEDRIGFVRGVGMRLAKSLAKPLGLKQKLSEHFVATIYRERRDRLLAAVTVRNPDAVLVIRGNHYDGATLAAVHQSARTVCWFIRDQKRGAAMAAERPFYDLYYSMHRSHEAEDIPYLPAFAYEPDDYSPDRETPKDIDLLFLGIWTPRRQLWLESLREFASRLTIIGPRWRQKLGRRHPLRNSIKADWVAGEEVRQWYRRAKVVINVNQWDVSELTGANLRIADVPACGTVLLTEFSADLAGLFSPGEELAVFRNMDELRERCTALLEDHALRQRMEAGGNAAVIRLGTYKDRMARILRDLQSLPN